MRVWLTIFAAFALFACGKSHGPDSDSSPLSASDFVQRYNDALRDRDQRCCEEAGLILPDGATAGDYGEVQAKYDAKAAVRCLGEVAKMSCPLAKGDSFGIPRPEICGHVFTGTVLVGERCNTPWDCAPSDDPDSYVICLRALGGSPGVCTEITLGNEGESCKSERELQVSCRRPLWCDPEKSICVAPAKLGEACLTGPQFGDTCTEGAMCDRLGTKRCVKPTPVGKPCETIEDCESLACVAGECREPLFVLPLCKPE